MWRASRFVQISHSGINPRKNTTTTLPYFAMPLLTYDIDISHRLYASSICLGVMRKLLLLWLRGKKEIRMSAAQADEVSRRLVNLQGSIPALFARKPRSLNVIDRWKATEFRQFLLYTGKVVLKGVLKVALYHKGQL